MMNLTISIFLMLIGLLLLWKTGSWSVNCAIRFSIIYRIESFLVGFFIFAISTSLPEITSAIISSLKKIPELSAGDLMGSTFVNLSLLLGISAIIAKNLIVENHFKKRLILTTILILLIFILVTYIPLPNLFLGASLLGIYLLSFWGLKNSNKKDFSEQLIAQKKEPKLKPQIFSPKVDVLIKLVLSLSLLILSSWLTVLSAVSFAKMLQIPIAIVGGTIIAIGTGLPELTLEIHAIRRKEYALALGDIFGSSLVNVSFVLGLLLSFNPTLDLSIAREVFLFLIPATVLIFFRLITQKPLNRYDGIALICLFIFYCVKLSFFSQNSKPY